MIDTPKSKWSNLIQIYRMMFKYWYHMVMGLITMFFFALFSGVSITLFIPLFDYVFNPNRPNIIHHRYDEFLRAVPEVFRSFGAEHGSLFKIRSLEGFAPLWEGMKALMLQTDS
ncbi:MAG: hypothetical protein U1C33_08735, partial [Candidatus Cloacimonadaceae bacterium]|nr:hypothetical protein [Candidatus Cloacimonadaceae bacterium]